MTGREIGAIIGSQHERYSWGAIIDVTPCSQDVTAEGDSDESTLQEAKNITTQSDRTSELRVVAGQS